MQHRFIYTALLAVGGLLGGCSAQQMRAIGEARCLDLPTAQLGERLDCSKRNKRVYDEFEKTQRPEPLSLQKVEAATDPLCFKNSRAGEKPCAPTETTGK